jgi:hypothetical protein
MELLTLKCLFSFGALPTNWGWLAVASQDRGLLFPDRLPSGSIPPPYHYIKAANNIQLAAFFIGKSMTCIAIELYPNIWTGKLKIISQLARSIHETHPQTDIDSGI